MFTSRIWRCQGWASTCLDKTAWLIGFLLETFKMLIQPPHMKKGCSPQIKLNMIFVSRSRSQQASSLLWRKDVVSCGYYMLLGRFGTNSILLRNIDWFHFPFGSGPRHQLTDWTSSPKISVNMHIVYCCLIIRPDYVEAHGLDGQIFMFQKFKTTDSPDWFRTDPIIQKLFFWLSLPLFLHVLWMWPWNHERFQEPAQHFVFKISRWIIQEISGTGFDLFFPIHHSTIPMSRWSFDWCFQALLVSTQVRWARPIHQRFMDPLGRAETGWKGWREWTAKWNWMKLFRYWWESFLSWVRPSSLGKVGDWCVVFLFPK